MLIYEVHLGSWKNKGKEIFLTYQELASELVQYVVDMGYTHIELLPLSEHPLDASWGYQATGYYAATSRYGTPEGLMELVNQAHNRGVGVIVDWVPGHFCKDDHGLRLFDGTAMFEPDDWRLAEKPLWGTLSFDFSTTEVQSFLISNAIFWLDVFHIDGLRVDAVASMIDRNFDKPESMRTYNEYGGGEYLEATSFLKRLNETVSTHFPDAIMIAEDSSDYPLVTTPSEGGGLGFSYKWNMGWMNDMLQYMCLPPENRPEHHTLLNFAMMYAYNERFVLPLSHDEVVHGKRSLLDKMPGSYEQKFANLRLFLAFWIGHPGKKLLFMGGELAQFAEWKDADQLDWHLLEYDAHRSFRHFSRELNHLYTSHAALWQLDFEPEGFQWIDPDNAGQCILTFIRYGSDRTKPLVFICNFSTRNYDKYRIGVPGPGTYRTLLCSDDPVYGGAGIYDYAGTIVADDAYMHQREHSIEFALPGLTCMIFSTE
jgi:1,4-alpha-glucan branching enzyme